jgi:hypothetical protein
VATMGAGAAREGLTGVELSKNRPKRKRPLRIRRKRGKRGQGRRH